MPRHRAAPRRHRRVLLALLLVLAWLLPGPSTARERLGVLPPALEPGSPSQPGPDSLAMAGTYDPDFVLTSFGRSYYPGRTGQLMFSAHPGVMFNFPPARFNHGSVWEYDTRVPLVFYGPGQIRATDMGPAWGRPYDIPPTLAAAVGLERPPTMIGTAWNQIFEPDRQPVRAMLVVVMDQVGYQDMLRFAESLPTLYRWRRAGADFSHARLDYLPSFTAVSHAGVGTGGPPSVHGICNNLMMLEPGSHKLKVVYRQPGGKADPGDLMAPSFADLLDLRYDNRSKVISQVYAEYAAIGLAGHGAQHPGGDRDLVIWYDKYRGVHTTDSRFYGIPDYIAEKSIVPVLDRNEPALVMTPQLTREIEKDPAFAYQTVLATPWFARYEADNLLQMMVREGIGRDEVPDLVMVNFKSTDATGHIYGHDEPGYAACIREIDRFLSAADKLLRMRAGEGRYIIAVTSDHGLPPQDAAARLNDDLEAWLGKALDALGDQDGVSSVRAIDGYHVHLDMDELAEEGHTLEDARQVLLRDPDVLDVWTVDQVRRRHDALYPVEEAASQ